LTVLSDAVRRGGVLGLIRFGETIEAIDAETIKIFFEEFSLENQRRNFLTVPLSALWPSNGNFTNYFNMLAAVGTIEWE